MPKSAGRPRDSNPAATRREILRAAEESFARLGFAGATTRKVAASAGVNIATLHYHFGGKEGLYRAVLARAEDGELPPLPRGDSLEETVRAVVPVLLARSAARPSLSRLSLLDSLVGPPGPEPREAGRVAAVAAALETHLPPPGGPDRARQAARALVALLDAAVVSSVGGENGAGPPLGEALTAAALRLCEREG